MTSADHQGFSSVDGGVVAAAGFRCAAVHCGLKKSGAPDIAIVTAEHPVSAAALFTTNRVAAAPVELSRVHIGNGSAQTVVINAGNANACTGPKGLRDAARTAEVAAAELGCATDEVLVCSTGVIGVPLPVDLVVAGVSEAATMLDNRTGDGVAQAIMTTDTFSKQCAVSFRIGPTHMTVGGMAKGSGMLKPNMATMLSVITTDAPLTPEACDHALRTAAATTFNRVTVDGDTSTNDTLILMASGAAGGEPIDVGDHALTVFVEALRVVSMELSRMLARDGEGATKLVTVTVDGASSDEQAASAAFAIADSPLVKTALFGNDANWGRIAMAVGKSGADVDVDRLAIRFAGIEVCRDGTAVPFDEDAAAAALDVPEVAIEVDLGLGAGSATVLTCDLSYEYVRINGEYRS